MTRIQSFLILTALACAVAASQARAEELKLQENYVLPLFVPLDFSITVDTPFCPDGELTGAGWLHARLLQTPDAPIRLVVTIPTTNSLGDRFRFCGESLVASDEGAYVVHLTGFRERDDGERLVLAFDIPLVAEDLVIQLQRGTHHWSAHFGDQHLDARAASPDTAFKWAIR